jgi:hypothetical protein
VAVIRAKAWFTTVRFVPIGDAVADAEADFGRLPSSEKMIIVPNDERRFCETERTMKFNRITPHPQWKLDLSFPLVSRLVKRTLRAMICPLI